MDRERQKQGFNKKRKYSVKLNRLLESQESKQDCSYLKLYIQSNVQSKRKNILALYDNTITDHYLNEQRNSFDNYPATPTLKDHRKVKEQSNFETNEKMNMVSTNEKSEDSMIVSSKFSPRPKVKHSPLSKLRWRSVEPSKNIQHHPKIKVQTSRDVRKRKPPLPALPEIKLKSSRRRRNEKKGVNEINPWQYLVIPEQTCFSNL